MANKFPVYYESTPNPNSMKFFWGAGAGATYFFEDVTSSMRSPLAHKLFGFPWIKSVLVGESFVTITKQDWVDWKILAEPLTDLIGEHLERNECVLPSLEEKSENSSLSESLDTDSVSRIKRILENEIRPAVHMDGGDVIFDSYKDGILYVSMQGSCSGCPSSSMTLKHGIEARLKEAIPDLKEVIAV
jgi:Fe-S cluster biogenesis protein NfuA